MSSQAFAGHSSIVLAAEGMDDPLEQSAVATVLGSHATGDLLAACRLVTSVSNSIQLFASDIAQAAGSVVTSQVTMQVDLMQVDLTKYIGSLGDDRFTGNFSNMKSDANHLASEFLTDFKSLGPTIRSVSSALLNETTTIFGNTMSSVCSIIGGGIENAASSSHNTLSSIGSDFVNSLE